jgi:hypothetical protein
MDHNKHFLVLLSWTEEIVVCRELQMSKVISNNIAVCLLYAGRLKDGLQVLETSITADTNNIQV